MLDRFLIGTKVVLLYLVGHNQFHKYPKSGLGTLAFADYVSHQEITFNLAPAR